MSSIPQRGNGTSLEASDKQLALSPLSCGFGRQRETKEPDPALSRWEWTYGPRMLLSKLFSSKKRNNNVDDETPILCN
jgi:hypothetical protein